jgi:ribosomal protein L11 methyltransferase
MSAGSSGVARLEADEQVARRVADAVCEYFAADDVAVSLTEAKGRWQVAIHFRTTLDNAAVKAAVLDIAGRDVAAALHFDRLQATDWVKQSLAGLAPVAAGRFLVHGAHDRSRVPPNRIGIEIEAALAFGTGHHGTTRGCLIALDRILKATPFRRTAYILDVGTGSGVLAIAAARALRTRVLATDIDAGSVHAARDNVRHNRARGLVTVVLADGAHAQPISARAPYDLIFANILLGPLKRLATPLRRLAAPRARLVLSGVLPSQANAVIASYSPLVLERRFEIDGWTTLVFRRRAGRRSAVAPTPFGS